MSFLELVVFLGLVFLIYLIFKPLERRLEWKLYKLFRTKDNKTKIVDITEKNKKEK
jgi:hypothetical protein